MSKQVRIDKIKQKFPTLDLDNSLASSDYVSKLWGLFQYSKAVMSEPLWSKFEVSAVWNLLKTNVTDLKSEAVYCFVLTVNQ